MPGEARMANGRDILAFAICATDTYNIHYTFSNDGTTWSSDLGAALSNQDAGPTSPVSPHPGTVHEGRSTPVRPHCQRESLARGDTARRRVEAD
jgi:hypothetical protein